MNLIQRGKKKPLVLERACDVHSSQTFFKGCDVDCPCLGNLVGPLSKQLCPLLRDAELVAAVD